MNYEASSEIWREVISWIKTVLFAVIFALGINNFVIVNASVPTGSMENTIMSHDRIVAFRLSYMMSEPERFDIVVFRYPDDESILYVKRVIGLPGDTVLIRDGQVYINDAVNPLDEPYLKQVPLNDFGPYTVPKGHYFMLGDNRNNSQDSRYWENTYVDEEKILGKVLLKYYPKFQLYVK